LRVAALYDIHGMVVPLEAVLAELGDVDAVLIGGDAVSGPQPAETLELLRSLEPQTLWIRGNGERALGPDAADAVMGGDEAEASLRFTASQLSADDRNWLVQLPETCVLDIDGLGETLFCHASPRNDLDIVTPGTPDARVVTLLEGVPERVVVAGHTHMQDDREIGRTRWINPGSVGMPYEGEVAAFWAVLGPDVELRRTPFDVERSAEAVLASGWPGAQSFVEENIRAAVAREEVITLFEQIAADRGER
jgi:predicted phosphodiesterase